MSTNLLRGLIVSISRMSRWRFLLYSLSVVAGLQLARPVRATEKYTPPTGIICEVYQEMVDAWPTDVGYAYKGPTRVEALDPRSGKVPPIAYLPPDCVARSATLSPDGNFLAYTTVAQNVEPSDPFPFFATYDEPATRLCIRDLQTGERVRQKHSEAYLKETGGENYFIMRDALWRPNAKGLAVDVVKSWTAQNGGRNSVYWDGSPSLGLGRVFASDVLEFDFDPRKVTLSQAGPPHKERWAPAYSPDSLQLATQTRRPFNFPHLKEPPSVLQITTRDGKTRELAPDLDAYQPLWLKDNRILFYGRPKGSFGTDEPYSLWIINADGSGRKELLPRAYAEPTVGPVASVSPDCRTIATKVRRDGAPLNTPRVPGSVSNIADSRDANVQIALIDIASGKRTLVEDAARITSLPAEVVHWSPNGDQIAFTATSLEWPIPEPVNEIRPIAAPVSAVMVAKSDGTGVHCVREGIIRIIGWR